MFDVGFSEMMVIAVVALIVIGPERLPKVARTLGHMWGRAQRYVNSVKSDIARDMAVEEFRQLQQQVQQEASSVEQAVSQTTQSFQQETQKLQHETQSFQQETQNFQQEIGQLGSEVEQPTKKKFPID